MATARWAARRPWNSAPAAAAQPLGASSVALGHRAHREADHRLHVAAHHAVAGGNQNLAHGLDEARFGAHDARVVLQGRGARPLEQAALVRGAPVERAAHELVAPGQLLRLELDDRAASARGGNAGRGLGGPAHGFPAEILHVGEAGRVAALHPHAETHGRAARGRLEDPVVEHQAARAAVLEEEIGVVAALREAEGEQALAGGRVDRRFASRGEGGVEVERALGHDARAYYATAACALTCVLNARLAQDERGVTALRRAGP
jgi:hypothetical protein